jgi:TRAP-type mannitol/chloroaromatic compound transport system permease small subunit
MMQSLLNNIEKFIDWSGRTVSWLTLGMVLVTFVVVVLRYVFDTGWIALQESINYMHALVFLVGAAYTLKHNEHVRVDIFYSRLSPRGQAWIDLIGSLLILLPVMFFIIWTSWEYVMDSWSVLEGSREAGGLPGIFLLKSVILVMAALLIMQAIAMLLRSLSLIFNRDAR